MTTTAPLPPIPFLPARDFTPANRAVVDLIVIHTAEVAPLSTSAEALMQACHRGGMNPDGTKRLASWHFAIDDNSITQSVRETDVAWHAPGANSNGIGIELATRAATANWTDPYHTAMLDLAARLVAKLCVDWSIPLVAVDVAGLLLKRRGITRHMDVSNAFKKSSHQDPGPHFLLTSFVDKAIDATPTIRITPRLTS